jgi:hypothetical protein
MKANRQLRSNIVIETDAPDAQKMNVLRMNATWYKQCQQRFGNKVLSEKFQEQAF